MPSPKDCKLEVIHSTLEQFGFEMPESTVNEILKLVTTSKAKILKHHAESTSV